MATRNQRQASMFVLPLHDADGNDINTPDNVANYLEHNTAMDVDTFFEFLSKASEEEATGPFVIWAERPGATESSDDGGQEPHTDCELPF